MFGSKKTVLTIGLVLLIALALGLLAASCGGTTTTTAAPASTTTAAPASSTTAAPASSTTAAPASTTTAAPASTTTAAPAKQIHVALINQVRTAEAGRIWADKFVAKAKALGWQVDDADANGDIDKLVGFVDNAVAQKVDAIVCGFWDLTRTQTALEHAQAGGIPVFAGDTGQDPKIVFTTLSDDKAIGAAMIDELAKRINNKGDIFMFIYPSFAPTGNRGIGALDELKKFPDIKVIQQIQAVVPGQIDWARTKMQDLLTASPKKGSIAGLWALWDEPALGAAQACEAAGRNEVVIIGADGSGFAYDEMKKTDSPFRATIAQDWETQSTDVINVMKAFFADGTKPAESIKYYPGILVTQEDVIAGKYPGATTSGS
jgi:ribose transport system substrate-binding protein